MLENDTIDMYQGCNFNKTNESCKYIICNYNYFLKVNFRFQLKECKKASSFNDVAIVSVKGKDYKIHFWYMSKEEEAINLLKKSDLRRKSGRS